MYFFFYKLTARIFSPVRCRFVLTFILFLTQLEQPHARELCKPLYYALRTQNEQHKWKSLPSRSLQFSEGVMGLVHESWSQIFLLSLTIPLRSGIHNAVSICHYNPDSMDLPSDVLFQTFVSQCFYRNMAWICFSNSLNWR